MDGDWTILDKPFPMSKIVQSDIEVISLCRPASKTEKGVQSALSVFGLTRCPPTKDETSCIGSLFALCESMASRRLSDGQWRTVLQADGAGDWGSRVGPAQRRYIPLLNSQPVSDSSHLIACEFSFVGINF